LVPREGEAAAVAPRLTNSPASSPSRRTGASPPEQPWRSAGGWAVGTAPRKQPSTNRRRVIASPEIWWRIVHITLDGANGSASCLEQTVEVTLGPDWAFETGGLGSLTRRVPADQVVTAVPERVRNRRPKEPKEPRTPPVVETLRKALAGSRTSTPGWSPPRPTSPAGRVSPGFG